MSLEWTIGTVLGPDDTLMSIYVIDQDRMEDGGKIVPNDNCGYRHGGGPDLWLEGLKGLPW